MRVLHINVRLTEGGAARVALDLHRRMLQENVDSVFCYGYGKNAGQNSAVKTIPNTFRISSRAVVLGNFATHRLLGVDVWPPLGGMRAKLLKEIGAADVVHLHVIHSYYMPYTWLFEYLIDYGKSVVWTAHDHWILTGRCAITDGCQNWRNGCGSCPTGTNYPPSLLDISKSEYVRKKAWVERLGERVAIVVPSKYLAEEIRTSFPEQKVCVIPNGIDREMEEPILGSRVIPHEAKENAKPKILVIANDLSCEGKTDCGIVNAVAESGSCIIHTVGKNSLFNGKNIINHGEVASREKLVSLYSFADAMLFTSQVDSFGLVMAEALACGTPVIATHSQASREVLGMVKARPYASSDEIVAAVKNKDWWKKYSCDSRQKLKKMAFKNFSGVRVCQGYMKIYQSIINRA